jgi:hypothetical protein
VRAAAEEVWARLRRRLAEEYGMDEADLLFDRPSGGWDDLVTKDWLHLELAAIKPRLATVESRLTSIDDRLASVQSELHAQTWKLIGAIAALLGGMAAVFGGLIAAIKL